MVGTLSIMILQYIDRIGAEPGIFRDDKVPTMASLFSMSLAVTVLNIQDIPVPVFHKRKTKLTTCTIPVLRNHKRYADIFLGLLNQRLISSKDYTFLDKKFISLVFCISNKSISIPEAIHDFYSIV